MDDRDIKDFENLNFLRENTYSVLKPASPREVLSNCSNRKSRDLIGSKRGFHHERYLFGEYTHKDN